MQSPHFPMPVKVKRTFLESGDRMLNTVDLIFLNEKDEKDFNFMPGQFCEISILGKGEAPFGIASSPTEKGFLRFTVNKAGVVTEALHHLEQGNELVIRGPLGNYYPINIFKDKNVLIIGGGFVFTTLRALTKYLLAKRGDFKEITLVYGARTPGMLLYREEFREWEKSDDLRVYLTVDRGDENWKGLVGVVPKIVEEKVTTSENTYAVACGPPIMIKYTLISLDKLRFPPERVYLSLGRRMKCGTGKCSCCNIGRFYVCKDGPIFSYAQLKELPREY